MRGEEKRERLPRKPATLKSRLNAPLGQRNDSEEARRVNTVAGNSQKPSQTPRGRRNGSREARRFPEIAGNSQKPSQRPAGPSKRFGRSKKVSRDSRHLSKAASTPPGAAETTHEKREGFPRLPAPLKSRFNAPRGRRNDSREAITFPAVAGNSQKQPLRPPEAAETVPKKREGFPR